MEYAKLGNTDIEVSKLCVGCMSFGKAGTLHDWTVDEAETEKIVKHALDLGINFFDTANGYSEGTSEEYLGRAIKKNIARDKVVIASKVYFNPGRLSSAAIHREIEGTLERLGTDYLDLYIIHRFDYDTPIEETMEALNDLVVSGKVRAVGASAMYGYQFHNMQLAARDHGWAQFVAMENHYNLLYREDERELIPICRQMNVSLMPYSPLAADPPGVELGLHPQQDRQGSHGEIRQYPEAGYGDRAQGACARGKIWGQDAADRTGLGMGKGRDFPDHRRNESVSFR